MQKKARNSKNDPIFTISVEIRELQPFHRSPKKSAPRVFLVALKRSKLNTLILAECVIFCIFLDVLAGHFKHDLKITVSAIICNLEPISRKLPKVMAHSVLVRCMY